MTELELARVLETVLNGDASDVTALRKATHQQLRDAWSVSSRPPITAAAAKAVLTALRDGRVSIEEAGLWAQLVQRGYLSPGIERVLPINIEWRATDEEKIA